ncbi:MAG: methionyl-tRNA formyltransferase [Flavobacteriales bacterium]|nr:methionyl-tRNA formyltransferase [Flavobacteriales bacterium]|tara:strand:+ start:261 stop:926 length:666 start_codon:yes stop_codon:yes gene_type:complete
MKELKITILTDNPNSWIIPFVEDLKKELVEHKVTHIFSASDALEGDIMLILGCEKIIKSEYLTRHKSNIVVHPSGLPKGKGFSPLAWQIIEGINTIPVTLFEAVEKIDAGEIYLLDYIKLNGSELNDEIKCKQGSITKKMIHEYINNFPNIKGIPQNGEETFYKRRTSESSELSIDLSIKEQFNTLRVVDNERYPAYFKYKDEKYIVKIYKDDKKNQLSNS